MFFCEYNKKYRNFTQSPAGGILHIVPSYVRGDGVFKRLLLRGGVSIIPLHDGEDKDGDTDFRKNLPERMGSFPLRGSENNLRKGFARGIRVKMSRCDFLTRKCIF